MSLTKMPQDTNAAAPDRFGKSRRPLWRRWGFWFALAVAGCFAVVGGNHYYRHRQVADALQTSLEAHDREEPGWRLHELEAARAVVPDRENAAIVVEQTYDLLPRQSQNFGLHLRLSLLRPNERPWAQELTRLREELHEKQPALAKARELADLPRGRHTIAYKRNVCLTLLPHVEKVQSVTSLLCGDALVRAEDGDPKAALRSCKAALNAGRSLGDEPFTVSQLVRIVCVTQACGSIERVLAQGEGDRDDLLDLQRLLEDEERFPRLLVMMRGERALLNETFEAVESGDVSLADVLDETEASSNLRYPFLFSVDAMRKHHPEVLQSMTEAVEIARLPSHRRAEQIGAHEGRVKAALPLNPLYYLMFDLRKMDEAARRGDARLRCLAAALAVERYRLLHGGWPESLNDLTPDLLAEVPSDPGAGGPLGYRRYRDRVVIYSRLVVPAGPSVTPVAACAFDPDGDPVPGLGVAVHLFDVRQRRQPPGPRPPALVTGPSAGIGAVP